jgi:hypothetical protein
VSTNNLVLVVLIGIALVLGWIFIVQLDAVETARIEKALAEGTVCLGMSMEQVRTLWGSPDAIQIDRYEPSWHGSNQHVTWIYLDPPRTVTFHPAGYVEESTGG